MADGKITVTFKEGTGFDSPWVVASGDTVAEVRDSLTAIEQSGLLADVGRVAAQFKGVAALGGTLGAKPVEAPNHQQGQQATQTAPQGAQSAPAQGSWGAAPAASQQPAQGQQQPPQGGGGKYGGRTVVDNFKNTWEYDVPNAPMTPRGPAIIKHGNGPKGPWAKWNDPAAGPEWFTARNPKVAAADRWSGDFL